MCNIYKNVELKDCLDLSGINSPDTALYESLKLLCSLLVTLVGKGLYGPNGSASDTRFIDQGMVDPAPCMKKLPIPFFIKALFWC